MAQTKSAILSDGNDSKFSDQDSSKVKKRFCVVVLGMHRSGTSALARTLNMLGCDLPKTVLPANKNNEKGYWESGPVVALNNELLSSAGSSWQDLRAVDPGWFASPKGDEFRQKAHELLEDEFGGSHLFVLKDPRICRLAPFWLDVLESSSVSPFIILPIRHPLEVMSSSSQMKGLEPAFVSLIWLHHVLEAEYFSRGKPRCFTSYDRLLSDWKNVAIKASKSFGFSWPSLTAKSAEISTFLSLSNRHHIEDKQKFIDDESVAIWIRETYRLLDSWAESGEKTEDFSALDRIRAEFNAATPAFMAMYAAGDKSTKRERRLKVQLEETTELLEQQCKELEMKTTLIASLDKDCEESRLALRRSETTLSDVQTRLLENDEALKCASDEVDKYRQSHIETTQKFEIARTSLAEQSVELSWLKKELEAQRTEVRQSRQDSESSRIREVEVQRYAADLAARLRQHEEVQILTNRELDEYRVRENELRRKYDEARHSLAELGIELSWVKKELELQRLELTQVRQENEIYCIRESESQRSAVGLDVRLRQLEGALSQSHREIDQYRESCGEANLRLAVQEEEIAWLKKEIQVQLAELTQTRQETENSRIRENEAYRNAADLEARLRQNEEAQLRTNHELDEYRARDNEVRLKFEQTSNRLAQQEMQHAWVKKEFDAQRADLKSKLAERESVLAQYRSEAEQLVALNVSLEQEKRIAEKTIATLNERLEVLMAEEISIKAKLQASVTELRALKTQLNAEMSRIQLDVISARKQLFEEKALREWMHKATPLLVNVGSSWKNKLWNLAPAMLSHERRMKRLKREGLFDAAAYLSANPDVAQVGMDPLYHYLRYGMHENRQLTVANSVENNNK